MLEANIQSQPRKDDDVIFMDKARAKMALRPTLNAAWVITSYDLMIDNLVIVSLTEELSSSTSTAEVITGKMDRCEAMLLNQTYALQSIFTGLSQKTLEQSQIRQYNTLLKPALKAQSQCRTTLETLANLKKPPTIFANQANMEIRPNNLTPSKFSNYHRTVFSETYNLPDFSKIGVLYFAVGSQDIL